MDAVITPEQAPSQANESSERCYINEIPPWVEAELEQLYGTLHSSLPFFRVFRSVEQVHCYVSWCENRPTTILLFHCKDKVIEVLNEMIELRQAEVERFARTAFQHFPAAGIIRFKAIGLPDTRLRFPAQRHNAKDTYVITLPRTPEEYLASLGKNLRTAIKYQLNKIKREHPSFASRFYVKEEIDEQHIREIIRLSEMQISKKVLNFYHDEERIIQLAKLRGFVHVVFINGRVCGGSINYCIANNYFGDVISRDLAFKTYGLGRLSAYLTICESIRRGGKQFYMGGGRFDYKEGMRGIRLDMDHLEIYRSHARMALHLPQVTSTAAAGYIRRAKMWLHEHKENVISKWVFQSFYFLQNMLRPDR